MIFKKFFLYFIFPLIFLTFLLLQYNQYQKKHIYVDFKINDRSELLLDFEQTFNVNLENKEYFITFQSDLDIFLMIMYAIESYLFNYVDNYLLNHDHSQMKDILEIKYDSKNRNAIKKIVFKKKVSDQLLSDFVTNISNTITNEDLSKKTNLYNYFNKLKMKINFVSKDDQIKFDTGYKNLIKRTDDYNFIDFNIKIERNLSLIKLIIYFLSSCILFILYFLLILNNNLNYFIKSNLRKYLIFDK